jgi:hypothetical protein
METKQREEIDKFYEETCFENIKILANINKSIGQKAAWTKEDISILHTNINIMKMLYGQI